MSTFLLESTRTPRCRVQIIDLISLAVRALSSGSEPYAAAFPQICELEGLDNDIASPLRFSPVLFLIFSYSPSFFSLFFFFIIATSSFSVFHCRSNALLLPIRSELKSLSRNEIFPSSTENGINRDLYLEIQIFSRVVHGRANCLKTDRYIYIYITLQKHLIVMEQ